MSNSIKYLKLDEDDIDDIEEIDDIDDLEDLEDLDEKYVLVPRKGANGQTLELNTYRNAS